MMQFAYGSDYAFGVPNRQSLKSTRFYGNGKDS